MYCGIIIHIIIIIIMIVIIIILFNSVIVFYSYIYICIYKDRMGVPFDPHLLPLSERSW